MADYRQVKVPVFLMVLVDRAVVEGAFRSPSAFVNDAVRRRLEAVGLLPIHASDPVAPGAPVPAASPRTRTGGGERRGAQRASTAERGRRRAGKDRGRGDPPGR